MTRLKLWFSKGHQNPQFKNGFLWKRGDKYRSSTQKTKMTIMIVSYAFIISLLIGCLIIDVVYALHTTRLLLSRRSSSLSLRLKMVEKSLSSGKVLIVQNKGGMSRWWWWWWLWWWWWWLLMVIMTIIKDGDD